METQTLVGKSSIFPCFTWAPRWGHGSKKRYCGGGSYHHGSHCKHINVWWMMTPQTRYDKRKESHNDYGLGWYPRWIQPVSVLWHNSNTASPQLLGWSPTKIQLFDSKSLNSNQDMKLISSSIFPYNLEKTYWNHPSPSKVIVYYSL